MLLLTRRRFLIQTENLLIFSNTSFKLIAKEKTVIPDGLLFNLSHFIKVNYNKDNLSVFLSFNADFIHASSCLVKRLAVYIFTSDAYAIDLNIDSNS